MQEFSYEMLHLVSLSAFVIRNTLEKLKNVKVGIWKQKTKI